MHLCKKKISNSGLGTDVDSFESHVMTFVVLWEFVFLCPYGVNCPYERPFAQSSTKGKIPLYFT